MPWTATQDLPAADAPLPDLVRAVAAGAGGRAALIDGPTGRAVGYDLLAARIEAVAGGLAARGFGPGDVLALWAPNEPRWAGVALAAMAAGGAVTGIHPAAAPAEVTRQLEKTRARVLVCAPGQLEAARALAGGRELVVLGDGDGATPVAALLGDARAAVATAPGGLALLPYSSGTGGPPKPVMLTHANVVAGARQAGIALALTARDTVLALPPFAHIMGFAVTLCAPLLAGATVVTMPRFDLGTMLALLARHRITVLAVPPPVAALLARHPAVQEHDLAALELIVCGGAPLAPELHERLLVRFPRAGVGQGYGLTETAVAVSGPDGRTGSPPGTVGRLMAGTALRVVDPAGRDLGPGEAGELLVRGPQVMAGYLGRPEATAAAFAGAWLRTGDLGHVRADGTVVLAGRLKELIKVDALQVAPAELESLLLSHPQVADAAVVGRPDERHGEVPVAMVVPDGALDADALAGWVAARVAPHKRLRAVRTVTTIPRTPSGKILRRALR